MENTIWLHVKSGNLYVILDIGLRERDLEPEFEYKRLGEDNQPTGVKFHRSVREFLDGRFTQYQVNGVGGEVENGERAKRAKTDGRKREQRDDEVSETLEYRNFDGSVAGTVELPRAPKTGRPAYDADENTLKVGDWVRPDNVSKRDHNMLPKGSAPYQIKRIAEGDFPKIFFSDESDATGWYPAVFHKDDAPDELP
jgi:hypothetical protein